MSDPYFIEVQPATEHGNAEPKRLINARYVVAIVQQRDPEGIGATVLGFFDQTTLAIWDPYSHLASQILTDNRGSTATAPAQPVQRKPVASPELQQPDEPEQPEQIDQQSIVDDPKFKMGTDD